MFKNIKHLSQISFGTSRLVFESPEAPRAATEKQRTMAEQLEALKASVSGDFREHLATSEVGIRALITDFKPYNKGNWETWNIRLAAAMTGVEPSREAAIGIVKRLQEYLKSGSDNNRNIKVDGQFGPELRNALLLYYSNLKKPRGWVHGFTKEEFKYGARSNESYFLTYDNRWVSHDHKPVDFKTRVLPAILQHARVNGTNSRGYYEIKDSANAITYYIDGYGNTYKNAMPSNAGSAVEMANPYEDLGEDPRKNAREFVVSAERGLGVEKYYLYSNGLFTDEKGEILNQEKVAEVLAKGANELVTIDRTGTEEQLYKIELGTGEIAYYDADGSRVDLDKIRTSNQRYAAKGTNDVYFRYEDRTGGSLGSFSDKNGKTLLPSEVIPKIAEVETELDVEEEKLCYTLDINGKKVRCDVGGRILEDTEKSSEAVNPGPKTPIDQLPWDTIRSYLEKAGLTSLQYGDVPNTYRFNLPASEPGHLMIEMSIKNDKQIDLRLIDINREVVASGPAISPEQAFAEGHTRYLAEDLPHVLGRIIDWARSHTEQVDRERKAEVAQRGIPIDQLPPSSVHRYMKEVGFTEVVMKEDLPETIQHHFEYRGMECSIHIVSGKFFRFSADKPTHLIWNSPTPEQFSSQRNSSYTEKDMPRIMQMIKSHLDAHIEGKE